MDANLWVSWRITLRYAVVLGGIAAMAFASFLMLGEVVERQTAAAVEINIAGRQRMLTQRIELLARNLVRSPHYDERRQIRDELIDAVDLFERSHIGLVQGDADMKLPGRLSDGLKTMYFDPPMEVDAKIRALIEAVRRLVRESDPFRVSEAVRALEIQLAGNWELLARLDAIVAQYQRESESSTARMERGAQTVLGLTLFFLLLTAVGVFFPLSKRVREEIQQRDDASHRLRGILESAMDAVITIDSEGKIVEFSPSARRMFGYEEDVLGRDVADTIIPPPLRKRHREALHAYGISRGAVRNEGGGVIVGQRVEMMAMRADGSEFPVEVAVAPVELGDHRLFTAFVRDLTKRRATEDAMRKLSRAVEQSPATIMITDTKGRIEYVNPKFEAVTGYAAAEVIGRTPSFLKSGDMTGEDYARLWHTIAEGGEWRGELHNRRKDGSLFWEYASISPVKDLDGTITHYVAVKEDVTDRKAAEKALREAKEQAELANRSKTEFLANMSHELRTPLNSVIGFSDLMLAQIYGPIGRDEYLEYARDINDSGRHLLALINDILDISRLEISGLPLEERLVDLGKVAGSCLHLVRGRADDAGLETGLYVGPDLPPLLADERRVKQILLNLLANSIKFTPRGGRIRVEIGVNRDGWMEIAVSDTGIGIAPEDVETVLSVFGQVDGGLARKYEGAGLGLPLSRKLAQMHGGDLAIESSPGQGTTVRVLFPPERIDPP